MGPFVTSGAVVVAVELVEVTGAGDPDDGPDGPAFEVLEVCGSVGGPLASLVFIGPEPPLVGLPIGVELVVGTLVAAPVLVGELAFGLDELEGPPLDGPALVDGTLAEVTLEVALLELAGLDTGPPGIGADGSLSPQPAEISKQGKQTF